MPDSAEAAGVSGHRVGMEPTAEGPAEEQPWFLQRVAASRSSCLRVPQASCENQRDRVRQREREKHPAAARLSAFTIAVCLIELLDVPNFLTRPGLFRVGLKVLGHAPRQRQVMDERRQLRRLLQVHCRSTTPCSVAHLSLPRSAAHKQPLAARLGFQPPSPLEIPPRTQPANSGNHEAGRP